MIEDEIFSNMEKPIKVVDRWQPFKVVLMILAMVIGFAYAVRIIDFLEQIEKNTLPRPEVQVEEVEMQRPPDDPFGVLYMGDSRMEIQENCEKVGGHVAGPTFFPDGIAGPPVDVCFKDGHYYQVHIPQ